MAVLTRARGMALAGVTALAVTLPISPVLQAPAASAAAAPRASVQTPAAAAVPAADRKKKSSRSARSFAVRAASVMRTGNSLKGVPYRYGGSTPRGIRLLGVHLVRVPQGRRQAAALGLGSGTEGASHLARQRPSR